ncbi:hypothetical protein BLS_009293 [Venturia inaequalis]|uniref:Uncharacterized protein n=1 Tax=Venturia inaequalis TaxID=5025 RepID=A0A8H3V2R6_VENIN|nr:hypothetical protein BLS_009293 [Venturia inaequalis]
MKSTIPATLHGQRQLPLLRSLPPTTMNPYLEIVMDFIYYTVYALLTALRWITYPLKPVCYLLYVCALPFIYIGHFFASAAAYPASKLPGSAIEKPTPNRSKPPPFDRLEPRRTLRVFTPVTKKSDESAPVTDDDEWEGEGGSEVGEEGVVAVESSSDDDYGGGGFG